MAQVKFILTIQWFRSLGKISIHKYKLFKKKDKLTDALKVHPDCSVLFEVFFVLVVLNFSYSNQQIE